uniref:Integrase catalytic domain-containing protein n=1 Tax=Hordeum vulgare subsp. vulgare TaxID=112509 RepID=A0A8I6Y7V3_HORVV
MLTRGGYTQWAMVMEVNLQAASLWDAIEDDTLPRVDNKKTMAALLRSTPGDMHCMLIGKGSAKAAWEAIRVQYQGPDRVRDGRLRRLRTEFETVAFKDGEKIQDFAIRISNLAATLRSLGDTVDEEKIVRKFLSVVPSRFAQIAFSMETLLGPASLTVEEVTGHLRAIEERMDGDQGSSPAGGELLLTREQWEAQRRQPRGGGPGARNDDRGKRGGNPPPTSSPPGSAQGVEKDQCRYFRKKGHWARDCRKKQRDEDAKAAKGGAPPPTAAANLTEAEEDGGPGLMMACVEEVVEGAGHAITPASTLVTASCNSAVHNGGQVFLNEEKAAITPSLDDDQGRQSWFLDTGATNHMTGSLESFAELDRSVSGTVRFADGSTVKICGRGTVVFAAETGDHNAFTRVYYIPALKNSVVSLGQLDESWYDVHIRHGILTIRDDRGKLLVKVQRSTNRLCKLTFTPVHPVCLAVGVVSDAWRWHARLGHLHFDGIEKMGKKKLVHGLPHIIHTEELCEACLAGKQRRMPLPQKAKYRASTPLELVHGDLCGPITPPTPGGRRYVLVLIDDRSRFMWVELLKTKDEAARAIVKFQTAAEVECGHKLRVPRTDRGGEFTSATFYKHCKESGVQRHLTAPYTPQQNGVVELRNQTLLGMARSMLKAKQVPNQFWGEAVLTAAFILNRSFTRSVDNMTPYEAWYGRKPDVRFLRIFGCVGHVKVVGPHLRKLDDRSTPMVFISYEIGCKAYRMYDPATKRLHVSRDVVFDEAARWDWEAPGESPVCSSFTVEHPVYATGGVTAAAAAAEGATPTPASAGASGASPIAGSAVLGTPVATSSPVHDDSAPAATPEVTPVKFVSPPSVHPEMLDDADDGSAPHRYRLLKDLLGATSTTAQRADMPPAAEDDSDDEELHMVTGEEPTSFEEAEHEDCWRQAMLDELQSINDNNTWTLTTLPPDHRAIGLKWVYKLKKDENGNVVKHKACLVAKGYVQRAGVDFEEVFAPVARLESVRLILALAAHQGWRVHHMDVKSAFLNGDLEEVVYVSQPPGFIAEGREREVYKLHKALYGLRQAPRAWNTKLDASLTSLGFTRSVTEHGVYARGTGAELLIVGVYVDDLVITGAREQEVLGFKKEMQQLFSMSDLGLLRYYLGLEVKQEPGCTTITQTAYARKLLDKTGLTGCYPIRTPMETRCSLRRESKEAAVDVTLYRSVIGSLRYLTHTRPDISFAVGFLSRFMEAPAADHYAAVKQLLRYIAGTLSYGCMYRYGDGEILTGFSDSDHAGDVDTRKSTSGVLFFLGGSPVSWQSQKQKVVAISSCEVEYIAAATAACQGIWLARLIGELLNQAAAPFSLFIDNKSAISLCKNPVLHDGNKHIDLRYHFIRDYVEKGFVAVEFIGTREQKADILTKPLGRVRFEELLGKIGIGDVKIVRQG